MCQMETAEDTHPLEKTAERRMDAHHGEKREYNNGEDRSYGITRTYVNPNLSALLIFLSLSFDVYSMLSIFKITTVSFKRLLISRFENHSARKTLFSSFTKIKCYLSNIRERDRSGTRESNRAKRISSKVRYRMRDFFFRALRVKTRR